LNHDSQDFKISTIEHQMAIQNPDSDNSNTLLTVYFVFRDSKQMLSGRYTHNDSRPVKNAFLFMKIRYNRRKRLSVLLNKLISKHS